MLPDWAAQLGDGFRGSFSIVQSLSHAFFSAVCGSPDKGSMTIPIEGAPAHNADAIMAVARVKLVVVSLLSACLMVVFLGNVLLMSTHADIASIRVGGSVSIGVLYSVFVIFAGSAATVVYSWWANKWVDPATENAAGEFRSVSRPIGLGDDSE